MAVAFKRSVGQAVSTSSSNTLSVPVTGAIDVGDLVVIRVTTDNLSATTPTFSVNDGVGNVYTVHKFQGQNATAAAGIVGAIIATKATVAKTSGSIAIGLSGSVAHKAAYIESFTGAENTMAVAAVSNLGASTTLTTSMFNVPLGALVCGAACVESRTAFTGDTDTLGGAWSTQVLLPSSTSGTATSSVEVGGQWKVPNTDLTAQSYGFTITSTDWVSILVAFTASPEPAVTQAAYRWFDEGTESGAVALAAQDTAVPGNIANGDATGTLRIRLQSTTAVAVPATDDWQLQYEKNTSGSWINVSAVTTNVSTYDSPNLTNAAATTNRLTGGTGSFVAGKVSEDSLMDDLGWAGNNFTELVYALKVKAADVAASDTLRFRVLRNGATTGMTYTQTPTINIVNLSQTWTGSTGTAGAAGVSGEFVYVPPLVWAGSTATVGVLGGTGEWTTTTPISVTQEGFRWRNDDGSQTAATWLAAQDTNASLTLGNAARLRVAVETSEDLDLTPTLYYKKSTDSTWVPVPVGPGGGSPVYVVTSPYIVAGGEATTALLTAPAGGTFSTGRMWDDENGADLLSLSSGPPPFDPSTIPDLFGWFDAADNSSFVYSTEATKSVLWWYDKSPTGWDFETVSSTWESMKPLRDVTVNGLPAVRFPPTTGLGAFSIPGCTAQNITEFIVCVLDTGIGAQWVMPFHTGSPGSSNGGYALVYSHPSSATVGLSYAWTAEPPATNIPVPTGVTVGRLQLDATGKGRSFINRTEALPTRTDSAVTPTIKGGMALPGIICEILHYERALTAPEIEQVEDYLMEKWGVWTPAALSGLVGWWDARDTASVSGTATQISQWNDLSGAGHHLIPGDLVNNTSRLQAINGKQMVAQTAYSTDSTHLRTSGWTRSSVETIIGVVWLNGLVENLDGFVPTAWREVSGGERMVYLYYGQTWYSGWSVSMSAQPPVKLHGDPGAHILGTGHNGASSWIDHDGQRTTGNVITTPPVDLQIGPAGWLGWNFGQPSIAYGELLVFDRTLTTGELSTVYSYLSKKWGTFLQPTDITGLQAWYDAADGSTFSYSSGTVVSQWNDKSGNGRHLTQAVVADQPNRNVTLNGLPACYFNSDFMTSASFTLPQPVTVFLASLWHAYPYMVPFGSPGVGLHVLSYSGPTAGKAYMSAITDTNTDLDYADIPHTWAFQFNGASSTAYRDGVQGSVINPGSLGIVDGMRLSGYNHIGEVLVYNRILSATERKWVERYLKAKWAT